MRLIKGSLAGLVLAGILAIAPAAAFAMGAEVVGEAVMVGEAAVTDWAGEVEVTLLSGVVMHLADSQGVALVRDSGGCGYFPGDFLVAEMMAVSGIATLGTMGISEMTTNAIIAISSTILISLRSVFLVGGTLTTDTPTTEIPTRMRMTIPQPAYGDQYWQDLAMKVQWALSRRGYYHGPIDGVIGPDGIRAIQAFQEAQGWPATGRIDPNVLRALKLPIPQVALRSN